MNTDHKGLLGLAIASGGTLTSWLIANEIYFRIGGTLVAIGAGLMTFIYYWRKNRRND